jgi:tagatose 6-phosphate kinase
MILTVTLNPLVERRYEFDTVISGKANRGSSEYLTAGGKGINVSRQLNYLGINNLAITFAGGYSGKILKKLVNDEKIKASFIHTIDETRNSSVVIDKQNNNVTTFFGKNSTITESEASEFMIKLERMITNCEMVVFSGSSPSEVTNSIFPEGIKIANKLDKISVLDTYGSHFAESLRAAPTILHNNLEEIKSEFNTMEDSSIFSLLDEFYSFGIKQCYITNGPGEIYTSNFDFHFKIINPEILQRDPTGSGDAFTAGLIYGWHNNLTFEESAIVASCLGAANASVYETCITSLDEAELLKEKVKIIPVGKKMKIIDVSPQ